MSAADQNGSGAPKGALQSLVDNAVLQLLSRGMILGGVPLLSYWGSSFYESVQVNTKVSRDLVSAVERINTQQLELLRHVGVIENRVFGYSTLPGEPRMWGDKPTAPQSEGFTPAPIDLPKGDERDRPGKPDR